MDARCLWHGAIGRETGARRPGKDGVHEACLDRLHDHVVHHGKGQIPAAMAAAAKKLNNKRKVRDYKL